MWWLVALAALALVLAVVFLLRSRSRRRAWTRNFGARREDVIWLARTVIPQLAREPSTAQLAQGWRTSSARLAPLDENLARLEASAPNRQSATQANTLRAAVRSAATRIDALLTAGDLPAARSGLGGVRAELEAALASTER